MARGKLSKKWQQSDSEGEEDRIDINEEGDIPSDEGSEDQVVENEAKFAQFLDSDDEDLDDDESESEESSQSIDEEEDDFDSSNKQKNDFEEKNIRKRIESIPFAALAKAKRAMGKDEEEDEEDSELDEFEDDRTKSREKQEKKNQHLIEKRDNKHAPTELSSRRPVSRKRSVVDSSSSTSSQRRDPRFSSLSGSLTNKGLFRSSYGFLREQQSNEVKELKQVLGKLKKQEKHQAGPRSKSESALRIRQEREDVERALRRQEGLENERLKRERKDEVLRKAKKSIEDRVKQGGKRYFLKDSEKKKLILQDKFENLSGQGGAGSSGSSSKNDLKRAVERRRKKNSAKDRQMPLGGGAFQSGKQNNFGFGDGSMPMPKRKRARNQ